MQIATDTQSLRRIRKNNTRQCKGMRLTLRTSCQIRLRETMQGSIIPEVVLPVYHLSSKEKLENHQQLRKQRQQQRWNSDPIEKKTAAANEWLHSSASAGETKEERRTEVTMANRRSSASSSNRKKKIPPDHKQTAAVKARIRPPRTRSAV